MANNEYRLVRGMKDLIGKDADVFNFIVNTAYELAQNYNFQHLTTPMVEYCSLFERNLGNESDIIHKEIYKFEDRSGDMLALRPEMTASVCRFVIENGLFQGPFPHKYFSYGPVFRYDRPQKGRYRQFNQLNFEIFGLKDMALEIKVYLEFITIFLKKIGIEDVKIKINYLGSIEERKAYTDALQKYLLQYKNKLSTDSQRRLETNILRILDSKDEQDKEILTNAPKIIDYLTDEHKKYLLSFTEQDNNKDLLCEIDNNLVRGLDYYSGFVFEVITTKIGETQNSICGGGEYNNLINDMSGKQLSAFGFAFGIERLMEIMNKNKLPAQQPLYCHLTDKSKFISNARNEVNFSFQNDFVKGLKYANQIGADYVIFEKDGQLIQKDLRSGEQKNID